MGRPRVLLSACVLPLLTSKKPTSNGTPPRTSTDVPSSSHPRRKFVVYPLHSALTTESQKMVFVRPPVGIRKVRRPSTTSSEAMSEFSGLLSSSSLIRPMLCDLISLSSSFLSRVAFGCGCFLCCGCVSCAFCCCRRGRRHQIVISTNIAETSITIDDCVCVVDSGRVKENRYDNIKNMVRLVH
jgi:hypothetical protein